MTAWQDAAGFDTIGALVGPLIAAGPMSAPQVEDAEPAQQASQVKRLMVGVDRRRRTPAAGSAAGSRTRNRRVAEVPRSRATLPSIADRFADLLDELDECQRRGMITRLSVGYYEGWHPGRSEVADLVAVEIGTLTADECFRRQRERRLVGLDIDIVPLHKAWHRRNYDH